MKNSITSYGFAALLISLVFIGSCSLLEHDVEAELKATFNVNETQTGTNLPYNDQRTINAKDDEDIAKDLMDEIVCTESLAYLQQFTVADELETLIDEYDYEDIKMTEE